MARPSALIGTTATSVEVAPGSDPAELLRPYVPRLVIDWLRTTPDAVHREVEGSLVFVDVSGFTALSERLGKKGKVGAELMRDTLDGVFTALLDEAYDWGAGLLKWGGDALLLLFEGPEHAERACRAAWEMQRTIARVGRLHVSGDTVVLRMSVGIGTGVFHFFRTGSVHQELLIAGPAVSETLVMEAIADAEEIGISQAVATLLDPACVGPSKLAARLLSGPPQVERGRAPDVGDVRGLDIPSWIPIAARAHVLLQKSEAEHRTITAAFIDLMGTDRLLEELGPEGLAAGLDERIRSIEEAALRYEVPFYETDVGKSSVKALLTAGAPSSTGHDEERMLRALREIIEQPGIVPMRIGVNTGKVFTGDFGPSYRRAYRVFGDAINTAARVMAKAEPGQILSTEIVLNRSRTLFETVPIEPFAAKGKAEPVHASIVGPILGRRESRQGGLPLIGRDAELQILMEVLDQARDEHGSIVEVGGEPGVGRSRLVEELIARSPDFRVIRARCEEYESSTPYFPMRAVIRDVLGVDAAADAEVCTARLRDAAATVDADLVPWVPLLGILLGLDLPDTPETGALDERFLRDRLADVAVRFLDGSLGATPTMLLIEDVHLIDEASRELLARLSEAFSERRQALVVTHHGDRPVFEAAGEGGTGPVHVHLGPLSFQATVETIELATEDDPLHPHAIDEIAGRSGGNPLFLFELIDAVRETGSVASLPDSVEALIAGEIDRLAPSDRTILRYAAVLGSSFEPDLLVEAVRDDVELDAGVWTRLSELLEAEPSGALRFRNTLIRDAAYEGLPYRRRRSLHERVGRTIEARAGTSLEEEVGVLALHYFEAQRWDKAWTFCRQAGDRAMAIYANLEATRFYEKALVAGRRQRGVSSDELAVLHELSSDALYRLGEFQAADRALTAARRVVRSDPTKVAPILVKQAMVDTRTGDYARGLRRIRVGLRHLHGRRGPAAAATRARLLVQYAACRYLQNRRVESIAWSKLAAREAKRGRARDALATAYKVLDLALLDNGEVEKARYSKIALSIYEELGDLRNQASTLTNLGLIAHGRSEWVESRALYERGLAMYEQIGDRTTASLARFNISEILSDQGRLEEAEALLRDVLRVFRASGAELDLAAARMEFGKLAARRGNFDRAREMLEAARAEQERARNLSEVLVTDTWIAEMLVLGGDTERAGTLLAEAIERATRLQGGSVVMPRLRRLQAWALAWEGDAKGSRDAARIALRAARKKGDAYENALTLSALIAVGRASGSPVDDLEREREELFARLGIVEAPTVMVGASKVASASPDGTTPGTT